MKEHKAVNDIRMMKSSKLAFAINALLMTLLAFKFYAFVAQSVRVIEGSTAAFVVVFVCFLFKVILKRWQWLIGTSGYLRIELFMVNVFVRLFSRVKAKNYLELRSQLKFAKSLDEKLLLHAIHLSEQAAST
jgi:hypothetical protein